MFLKCARRATRMRVFRRVSAALLAMTFVLGVLQAGRGYLYCPMRDAVVTVHCCPVIHSDSTDNVSPALQTPDCCQSRHVDALPPVDAVSSPPTVVASPAILFVLVPLPRVLLETATLQRVRRRPRERAGPPIPTAPERAARLGVFLI